MRRAAAPLLILAVLVAVVVAWPRSQEPGSGGDATTKDAAPAAAPRLATSPGGPKPAAAPGPDTTPPPSPAPYRFEVRGDAGPLADATIATTEGTPLGKTDAEGRLLASFSAPGMWMGIGVIARHPGYAPSYALAERNAVCLITMEKGVAIRGRVVLAPGDLPVEGARVVASVSRRARLSLGETVTEATGRFLVEDAPRTGDPIDLVVRAAGHATATAHGKTEEEVLIRLEEGGILEGIVSDAGGKPLPNAVVYILDPDDPLPPDATRGTLRAVWSDVDDVDRTITNAEGHYEIAGVRLGKPRVAVALPTPLLFGRSASTTFERAGERIRRDVVVPAAGALRVIVEGLASTGGVEELLYLRGGGLEVQASAAQRSPDGSWQFPDLTPGRYEARFFVMGSPFIGRYTEVESGKATEVRLSFRGAKTIEGRVTTEDGTGVPHASVWWTGSTRSVSTADEEGRFRFLGLDESPGTLIASSFWGKPREEPLGRAVLERVVPGAGNPVRLVIGRQARVRARLPQLAPGTSVDFECHARFGSAVGGRGSLSSAGTLDVHVGVLGVPVEIILFASAFAPLRFEAAPLSAGEIRDVGEVRFETGRVLLLRIVDSDQAPVPAAGVQPDDPYTALVITDEKGEATLALMPRAGFLVAVTAPHRPPYVFAVPAETAGPAVLRLDAEGTLEIHVTERDGSPAAAARLTLLTAEENPYAYESDALTRDEKADSAGIWRGRVQPRAYRLKIRSLTGESETQATAVVRSGETTTLTVRMP